MRIGIVLSAGGLRGAAHLGVLRRIECHGIPAAIIVGSSVGTIIGTYYAAVGLPLRDMIDEALVFRGRHIIMHGLTVRAPQLLKPYLRKFCGIIPARLDQLESASFARLHHGVEQLGVVCHDTVRNQPCYFSTADHRGAKLADLARASAAVPGVLPTKTVMIEGQPFHLADGGISDSLPIGFAYSLGATHVIVSDCRNTVAARPPDTESLVYIRPELGNIRPLRAPRSALITAVWQGEAAVTPDILRRIESWVYARASS